MVFQFIGARRQAEHQSLGARAGLVGAFDEFGMALCQGIFADEATDPVDQAEV